jgi:PST family polysaccharide transporter
VLSKVAITVVQVAATMVLARLLTPADYGLVTMVTTFSLLLANFGFNGFTEAVIQREEINHGLLSNLFWINVGGGLLLTLGFAGAGSLLATFYRDPRVVHVAMGMSLTILLTSISVQHQALLMRAMRFSEVSVNDIVSRVASVAVAICLGWMGWGYWALVAGALMAPLSVTIGALILCPWVPGLPRRQVGTGSMVRFAMNTYGRFSVNYVGRNTDNFLMGWRFDAGVLGFYKRAYDLFGLSVDQTVSPLTSVIVTALSRLTGDTVRYKDRLLSALGVIAFLGMGLGGDLTLAGKDVIRLLLGAGWEESGRIFMFFGPGIGIMVLYQTHGWIHLSIGRADRWLRWSIVELAFTLLLFFLGLTWGAPGMAAAWTASFWILAIPAFWYAGRPIQLGVGSVIGAVWKFVVASLLAGAVCAGIIPMLPHLAAPGLMGALARIVVISSLFISLYLGAVVLLHRGCAPLYQLGGLLMDVRLKRL